MPIAAPGAARGLTQRDFIHVAVVSVSQEGVVNNVRATAVIGSFQHVFYGILDDSAEFGLAALPVLIPMVVNLMSCHWGSSESRNESSLPITVRVRYDIRASYVNVL